MAPAAATRSKKATQQAVVASPAAKVTKKKAPKAKKATKAKALPPPPPPRDDVIVEETSPGTLSPDEIEETPPPTARLSLDELIAQLSEVQKRREHRYRDGRVHKSRSHHHRRRRHRHSDTSDSSDSDSDEEERRGIPFRHSEGKRPFLSIAEKFRSVEVKYFKQIFFGTFRVKYLPKLAHMHTTSAKDEDKEITGLNQMMHCFHVYAVAAGRFAHAGIKEELSEALHLYAIRLLRLSLTYKFDSILAYHLAFMTARIQGGQDDPKAWEADDQSCRDLLVPKGTPAGNNKPNSGGAGPNRPAAAGVTGTCRNFNRGLCVRERCIYSHTCSICQQNHGADKCPKAQNSAGSSSNQIPLGNRGTKPE